MAGSNEFWDEYRMIGEPVTKNDKGDEIRVGVCRKKNTWYVDVRTFYMDKKDELQPGKGISINMELIDEVLPLIQQASTEE